MKKIILIFILLLCISIPAVKSLFKPGAYTSHDLSHHIVRQIDMDRLLSEGQFPPRWSGELNNGYGYPLFLFNYPGPALIGEVFHGVGFNFVDSVKGVMCLSMLASVIGMYLFLNSLFPKQKLSAFLGAVFYLYAPIRFINVYVAASVGASLAMGILPFIFWSMTELWWQKRWPIPVGSALLGLLIISHNVTALMFAPVLLFFSLILLAKSQDKKKFLINLSLMATVGLGMSSFFWIPAIAEQKYIVYDHIMAVSWMNQFPTIQQLIHSPWGYGLAHPGINELGAMSFQIGLIQILVMGSLFMLLIILRKKKEFVLWGGFSLIFFGVSVFLMNKVSTQVWSAAPLLYLIQFPFRFLGLSVFAASIGAAILLQYLPFKKVIFAILFILVLYANRNHLGINQSYNPGDAYFASLINDATSYNEHMPIYAGTLNKESEGKISILSGKGDIKIEENRSAYVQANIILEKDSTLRFNQYYYPGWELTDNGNIISFSYTEEGESKGLPVFSMDKGGHNFEATFKDTTDRKIADYLSLVSLVALGVVAIFSFRKLGKKMI